MIKAFMLILLAALTLPKVYAEPLQVKFTTSLEITPQHLFAGEFDTRTWLNPHNGVWKSSDLGQSWHKSGLTGTAVTDIFSNSEAIFATSYYQTQNSGLIYVSNDQGQTWNSYGPKVSSQEVHGDGNVILVGTYSHGLWRSQDNGKTWSQVIGDGHFGPGFPKVYMSSTKAIVTSSQFKTYTSSDTGKTWQENPQVQGKTLTELKFFKNCFFGLETPGNIFWKKCLDNWVKKDLSFKVYGIEIWGDYLYALTKSPLGTMGLYVSKDIGETWNLVPTTVQIWQDIHLFEDCVLAHTKDLKFISLNHLGMLHTTTIPTHQTLGLFSPPFKSNNPNDLVTKITAYFDHRYPFLGVTNILEPFEFSNTTMNFLGNELKEPHLYYSTHDGIDYGLNYGDDVLAVLEGVASYYYCTDCGHTIKITHPNGYTTVYMHLQEDNLVTTSSPMQVSKGQKIGKVGLTGRTSGPHLHFAVQKTDTLWPWNKLDPFGWKSKHADPWTLLGGVNSVYLWNLVPASYKETVISTTTTPKLGNLELSFEDPQKLENLTLEVNYAHKPNNQNPNIKFIEDTRFSLSLINNIGDYVNTLGQKVQLSIFLAESLSDHVTNTASWYYENKVTTEWEKLVSTYNSQTKLLSTQVDHFSDFAVFYEKPDVVAPQTTLNINNGLVTLISNELNSTTYFSKNQGQDWLKYYEPFQIPQTHSIVYWSEDSENNREEIKAYTLNIFMDNLLFENVFVKIASEF